jgi:Uma2 family endonuclease
MNLPLRRGAEPPLTADQFLGLDPSALGDAWRYELVGGFPVAMAPPTREHGLILGNLVRRLQAALDAAGNRRCSVAPGVGVKPRNAPGNRVRVPDAVVLCGERRDEPIVLVEVMSASNAGAGYEARRADLKAVEGVQEVVELQQDGHAAHVFRRHEAGWLSLEVIGPDAVLRLESLGGVEVRLAELYENVLPPAGEESPS